MSLVNLMKKGSLRSLATATPATVSPNISPSVATVATVAVAIAPDNAANDLALDLDRWAWPASTAMTGREIDTFTARLHRFNDKGLTRTDGEALADKLVRRDREQDDRRVCLECQHFAGHGAESWRCGNWQAAGIALRPRDAQLPADLVAQLQRCDGFAPFGVEHGLGFRVCKDLLLPDGHIVKIGGFV
jgi:hypothetical protein